MFQFGATYIRDLTVVTFSEIYQSLFSILCHIINGLNCVTKPYTVRCHYNAVAFLPNSHNRHPIARPQGRGMGCFFVSLKVWFIFRSHGSALWYCDELDRVITAPDCIYDKSTLGQVTVAIRHYLGQCCPNGWHILLLHGPNGLVRKRLCHSWVVTLYYIWNCYCYYFAFIFASCYFCK